MLEGKTGKLPVKVSVFRNPIEEMTATRRFFKRLSKFESEWIKGKADKDDREFLSNGYTRRSELA